MASWNFWKRGKTDRTDVDREEGMQHARSASSLPSSVFKACDVKVEAQLEAQLANVFLKHMATESVPISEPPEVGPARDTVSPENIVEFLTAEEHRVRVEAPDLCAGLDSEQLWVIADLTVNGAGLTRHRATVQMREYIDFLWQTDDLDPDLLLEMLDMVKAHQKQGAMSMLMHVLLMAMTNAYERNQNTTMTARS